MDNRPNVIEVVLTPQYARHLIRRISLQTGIGSVPLDEDLLQEALLRGVRAFRRIPDIRFPRALFRKIVRDTIVSSLRKKRFDEPLTEMSCTDQTAIEEHIDRCRRFERLNQALTALAAQDREIIEMFHLKERPIAEIATRFHRSEGAMRMVLLRSRRTLRRLLMKSV